MPTTRSTARGDTASSPASEKSTSGQKRKAEAGSPQGKATKRGRAVKQQTIEETLDKTDEPESNQTEDNEQSNGAGPTNGHSEAANGANGTKHDDSNETEQTVAGSEKPAKQSTDQAAPKADKADHDVEMTDNKPDENVSQEQHNKAEGDKTADKTSEQHNSKDVEMSGAKPKPEPNALDQVKAQENEAGKTTKEEASDSKDEPEPAATADAVQEDSKREAAQPSNILEKGIIYFFTRGRVGTDDPDSVQDLARSYFVLRPLAAGAKITEGSIQDSNNNRLFALPKKVWPKSGSDRFMVFVEKAKTDLKSLKEEFFQGSEYSTKTTGTSHTPPVTPIGEGVYAITTTGGGQGTTHLAYMLTIPSEVGEVQKDVGLAEKGSFVLSLKNPEAPGPANAQLPQKPDWPKEFIDEFRGRGWMPVHPKHLDYANAQMLLIGENFESSNNLEAKPKDEEDQSKETPEEELKKLEDEDEHRVEALKGDDSIFADLGISSKEYPKVMTTW